MANIVKPTNINDVWSATGVRTMPLTSKISNGWVVELPPYQTANWIEWKQDQYIAHNNQHGISVWDSTTEYLGGSSYTKGSDGVVYKCIVTNTGLDPTNPLNSAIWAKAFEDYGVVSVVANNLATLSTNYTTLSGVTASAARTNLSVHSKAESDALYAPIAGNASQTFSVAPATASTHAITLAQFQAALQQATEVLAGIAEIASQGEVNDGSDDLRIVTPLKLKTAYLSKSDNLAGLSNVDAARLNLGLGSMATETAGNYLTKSGNLSGLSSVLIARSNLGLGSMATEAAASYLSKSGNLSGLSSISTARANLGLGNSATLNVGVVAGTVAAGNDTRIVNAVQTSMAIGAGNGLIGGGDLSAYRTIAMGTPSTITSSTGNGTTAATHTHALDIASFFSGSVLGGNGTIQLPTGHIIKYGTLTDTSVTTFTTPFPNACHVVVATAYPSTSAPSVSVTINGRFGFQAKVGGEFGGANTTAYWIAIGE